MEDWLSCQISHLVKYRQLIVHGSQKMIGMSGIDLSNYW